MVAIERTALTKSGITIKTVMIEGESDEGGFAQAVADACARMTDDHYAISTPTICCTSRGTYTALIVGNRR